MWIRVLGVALVTGLVACGGGDKKAAEPPAEPAGEQRSERRIRADQPITADDYGAVFAAFQDLSRAVIDNAGDCNNMGRSLERVVARHAILFQRLRMSRGDQEATAGFMAAYGAQINATMVQMAPLAQACQSNPRVQRAIREAL